MNWNVTRQRRIAVISLDRPPQNRIRFAALAELDRLLCELGADDGVSVIVLDSNCPGYFSAGADLDDVGKLSRGEPPSDAFDRWLWTLLRIESVPQPVVAAVDGLAASGGCEIALASTLRVGSPAAQFALTEVSRGAIPGAGGTQRLTRLVGMGRAAHMILAARPVKADEALAIGLLNAVMEQADFRAAVLDWVEPIAAQPRTSLVAAKRAVVEGSGLPLLNGLMLEQRLFLEAVRKKS